MTYKEAITACMTQLAAHPARIFIGYGIKQGRAQGTMKAVPDDQIIETPVAESLMAGLATGLSLAGRKPVVFIERMDFVMNAMDQIVNHLNAAHQLSQGEFKPAVIFRVVVGNKEKPLFTGIVHTADHSSAMRKLVHFPVYTVKNANEFEGVYGLAAQFQDDGISSMIVEYKDLL